MKFDKLLLIILTLLTLVLLISCTDKDLVGEAYDLEPFLEQESVVYYDPSNIQLIGEVGETGIIQFINHNFGVVNFQRSYINPIVIVGPVSHFEKDEAHARIKDVESDSFLIRIEEWFSNDGTHSTEDISYIVIESGTHTIDGKTIIANTLPASTTIENEVFSTTFSSSPVVLSSIQTLISEPPLTYKINNTSPSSAEFYLQFEQNSSYTNEVPAESIGYIALQEGTYNLGTSTLYATTTSPFNQDWKTISISGFDSVSSFVASPQTNNDKDPFNLRYHTFETSSVTLKIQEEKSFDDEVKHNNNNVKKKQ